MEADQGGEEGGETVEEEGGERSSVRRLHPSCDAGPRGRGDSDREYTELEEGREERILIRRGRARDPESLSVAASLCALRRRYALGFMAGP